MVFYDFSFCEIGENFPFYPFIISQFFAATNMAPCQLLPGAWRIPKGVEILSKTLNIDFSIDDLYFTYQIKPFGKGHFTLGTNEDHDGLVEKFGRVGLQDIFS